MLRDGEDALPEIVATVADVLDSGGVVGLPTDTVYGLAASVRHPQAVAALFHLKQRPGGVPIAVLVGDEGQAWSISEPTPLARGLAAEHWPGALTLVVDAAPAVAGLVGSEDRSVGVRCPDQTLIRDVATAVGPLATTSANLHGEPTPVDAGGVAVSFPDLALLVDGGTCSGLPSTVVDVRSDEARVLRQGSLTIGRRAT